MIAVKLKGGLGNQMFQYAAARGTRPAEKKIYVDNTFLATNSASSENFTARKYKLDIFKNSKAKPASRILLNILLRNDLRFRISRNIIFPGFQKLVQEENEFLNHWSKIKGPVYLDGYFQSEKYFLHIRNELLNEFSFPGVKNKAALAEISSRQNTVSIHVRRGDYLSPAIKNYHGILPGSYYKKAIGEIEKKVIDPYYFIFSDDIGWCENFFQFLEERYTIMKQGQDIVWEDMYFMSQCRHHIIANSSYSWWGAWLSQQEGAINIAPEKWFNTSITRFNIRDIIPAHWLVIDNG